MNKTNTSQVCLLSKMLSKAELNSAFAPIVESFSFSELFLNLKLSKKETKYIHFFFSFLLLAAIVAYYACKVLHTVFSFRMIECPCLGITSF